MLRALELKGETRLRHLLGELDSAGDRTRRAAHGTHQIANVNKQWNLIIVERRDRNVLKHGRHGDIDEALVAFRKLFGHEEIDLRFRQIHNARAAELFERGQDVQHCRGINQVALELH